MVTIDGSEGEGGGQVLRNACALSLVTGEPFTIENIRGGRDQPGLMRQHLTAIEAACMIGGAECEGMELGSSRIIFRPGSVTGGDYSFAVGTAGSTALVLQTVLVPLALADKPSHLVIEGGTHASMAPPFDFIEKCFLPVFARMGPKVGMRIKRHGFFPRGGGRIEIDIEPAPLRRIECIDRGEPTGRSGSVLYASLDDTIAARFRKAALKSLPDWSNDAIVLRELPADQGPGIALILESGFENVTEIVSGFGKLGLSAERIGRTAGKRMAGYEASGAFAGPYLQDQLLLPMALAGGGAFTSVKISQHTRTAADIIALFTGRGTQFEDAGPKGQLVRIV
ncbi:RNA 3'-terminal phosphate cyclase [Altererythrobacter sp. SALINAS58]|uniref:RNA 3'-terminal phosphate cyclase n=1 Tax=Alteripontixanthobacter muriae TaxID=2705546 RepID=UPI0015774ACC|nr:RNA 3'-terminal phosphate cyclase [Alteripontixanthobacter muriae]NTZ43994.1 RNA 3'-terminal phosphate cyclase [Alteripontixanthobacter muriae]